MPPGTFPSLTSALQPHFSSTPVQSNCSTRGNPLPPHRCPCTQKLPYKGQSLILLSGSTCQGPASRLPIGEEIGDMKPGYYLNTRCCIYTMDTSPGTGAITNSTRANVSVRNNNARFPGNNPNPKVNSRKNMAENQLPWCLSELPQSQTTQNNSTALLQRLHTACRPRKITCGTMGNNNRCHWRPIEN